MAHWALTISAERYAAERLFHRDALAVDVPAPAGTGDEVLVVVAGERPQVVAVGQVTADRAVQFTRRSFDAPTVADELPFDGSFAAVTPDVFARVAARLGSGDRRAWLVSLDLPIEAATAAEAVRQFWSYVTELGPAELPTFVSPYGDELAMQAFVLGEQVNLDPEED